VYVIAVGDFYQLPPVVKTEDRFIEPDSPPITNNSGGCRSPGQASGRSAASSGSRAEKKRKAAAAAKDSDDEDAHPNVPVIMASLPPGFVTFTGAERADWSLRARAQLAVKAGAAAAAAAGESGSAGGSGASSGSAMAAAAVVDHKQQQHDTADIPISLQRVQQQQLQQDAGAGGEQPAMAAHSQPPSPQLQVLLQRMTQQLDTEQLRALGIPAARSPARQLPADVQQMLESRKDLAGEQTLLQKSRGLGLEMLLGEPCGAADVAGGNGQSSRSSGSAPAAAAAVVHRSPKAAYALRKELGRDLGYAESGTFPFWHIPSGNIYDRGNTMSPASMQVSVPGVSSSSGGSIGLGAAAGQQQQLLPPGMSPLQPGLTSSSRAPGDAGTIAAGGSGRPVLPQWREAAWPKAYCFKSPAWAAAGFKPVVLRQPFRQVSA
jgi:hypothetical protein